MDSGGMAEWSNAAVLKTAIPQGIVGSNPTPSVKLEVLLEGVLPAVGGSAFGGKTAIPQGIVGSNPTPSAGVLNINLGEMAERPIAVAC